MERDEEADAGYIRLTDAAVARTEQFSESVLIDLDAAGSPVGIEILSLTGVVDVDGICDSYGLTGKTRTEIRRQIAAAEAATIRDDPADLAEVREVQQAMTDMGGEERSVRLSLIVLYVSDLEASQQFYAGLGLGMTLEQHGTGPVHYSTQLGPTVLEVYPASDRPVTRTRLAVGLPGRGDPVTVSDPDGNVVVVERIGV